MKSLFCVCYYKYIWHGEALHFFVVLFYQWNTTGLHIYNKFDCRLSLHRIDCMP